MDEFRDWNWQKKNTLKNVSHLNIGAVNTNDTLITPYLLSLIKSKYVFKQFIETTSQSDGLGLDDPLFEKQFTKSKGLIHRYNDRVLLVVTNQCFANCRFCFRKSNWRGFKGFDLKEAINYLNIHKEVREVLISGGDPLAMEDESLLRIVSLLRSVKHVRVLRVATRVLSVLPYRITDELIESLKLFKPIWFAIHVNHIDEITLDFEAASKKIINAGFPIVSQTVLLRDINDNAQSLKELFCKLVELGIKPYYLFGCDRAKGNEHFRVKIETALEIMEKLRNSVSGLCMPFFAFDVDDGGKIVLEPSRIISKQNNKYKLRNFEGREYIYEDAQY